MVLREDIGIDLGTTSIIIYVKGKGIILTEPSVVAVNKKTNEIIAYGKKAAEMIGKNPQSIEIIKPLKDGVISNFTYTEKILKHYIKRTIRKNFFTPNIIICIPAKVTDVEKRAVVDVAMQMGAKKVELIEEPVAAAIGSGLDINKQNGNLIVDIGGGTADVAVISEGKSVVSKTITIAGNKFTEEVIVYVKRKYNILIGEQTAENIKKEIGSVVVEENDRKMTVRGKDNFSGLPIEFDVYANDLAKTLFPYGMEIVDSIKYIMQKTPPELIEDISDRSIYLTGGGSLIKGLDVIIEKNTGLNCRIARDPINCVVKGLGKIIEKRTKWD